LRRSDAAMAVWTTREKLARTQITFVNDKSDALPLGPSETELTVWVEWASAAPGTAELHVEPPTAEHRRTRPARSTGLPSTD
jgi:hypothetical protein